MTTLCFVFGRTQAAPSLFLCGFRKNRDFAGISLGSERFLGEEEQIQQIASVATFSANGLLFVSWGSLQTPE